MRFITWKEIAARLTVSVSTAKRLHAHDRRFPRKVPISAGRVGFPEDEANEYIAALMGAREAA